MNFPQGTQWDNALSNGIEPETRLQDVQVACGKRHMRVHLDFGPQPFRVGNNPLRVQGSQRLSVD